MHNYTRKIENKQQLIEGKLGAKLAYFVAGGIFEANSGCTNHTKSGKIFIDKNVSKNFCSLFNVLS
ncbi:MAG: hypothetical protein A3A58_02155 [Candidatus Blackburnbacteria bacterium RIFCSPLOWO2_01_FULL_41_27]|uniref:Uncharacterized protein n=1 Tax=Candidatus Blackburnbacteria bacterium RIFCSPLOWO2_01_FULL_41_27 TaxID=1797520 RepID=A0A1G1VCQ9_9BACT|nr:MAG: hypothetical protein A3F30_01930 [Candidatus Levybacteria bacterium RIFCSPHIGHO2_12_FULL_37_12]OGY13208.1 MAG: hypothetical protein A3A58_02155 [Candidatus Blackburnbacteria bacterium RIFCSPLOWO2_01_FULL_41_27]